VMGRGRGSVCVRGVCLVWGVGGGVEGVLRGGGVGKEGEMGN